MKPEEFDFIASLLKEYSGFSLVPSQLYLLESRLGPLLRQNNLIGLEDLVTSLKLNNTELRKSMIEAVSVNNTRFFRNKYVFENIKNFILQKAKKGKNYTQIKILSAGCASGQEPVSIALMLQEMHLSVPVNIYALDMSRQMIARAKKALYTHYEVQKGLPSSFLLKYFTSAPDNHWKLNSNVLSTIHYGVHNLMNEFDEKDFDIILCRNMLSFMTQEAQNTALKNLNTVLKKNGLLIIGASEVLKQNPYFEKEAGQIACYHPISRSEKYKASAWNLVKKPLFKSALNK